MRLIADLIISAEVIQYLRGVLFCPHSPLNEQIDSRLKRKCSLLIMDKNGLGVILLSASSSERKAGHLFF